MTSSVVSSQGGPPVDTDEEQLQAEVLFQAFVKSKAKREQKADIERAVEDEVDPEEASLVNQERNKEIGSRLAAIADDLDEQFREDIDGLIDQLHLTSTNAYESFALLARRLLTRGVTWGHIVALFLFGYRVIVRFFAKNIPNLIRQLIGMIGRFVVAENITQWVKEHGGWVQVLTQGYLDPQLLKIAAGVVFGLIGIAFLYSWWRK